MVGRPRKHDVTVKVFDETGGKIEATCTRAFGLKAIYVCMTQLERDEVRAMLDLTDKQMLEKRNG